MKPNGADQNGESGKSWLEKYVPMIMLTLCTSGIIGFIAQVSSLNKEILIQQGIINDMQRELNGAESDIDDLQKKMESHKDEETQRVQRLEDARDFLGTGCAIVKK